jgi:uncharacterized membrane protein YagU involved in acid resistance
MKTAPARTTGSAALAIFVGGLIAGILDITSAIVAYRSRGATPMRVFQSVASGAFGREAAFAGGMKTALAGLGFHFLIAFTAAAVFYLASRKLRFLVDHAVLWGLVYGLCVWAFMNYVVLPLSAIGHSTPPVTWQALLTGVGGHPFLVGLPIALATRKFGR